MTHEESGYEHFTDRSRKVMQLANQEAQRFNHEYVGTEHILLGLIKEGSGVAANVLKNLDIDLRVVRHKIEKLVRRAPDTVTIGRLPLTPRAKTVMEYAMEEAHNLHHNYVGTEHLLLALLRESEGVAAQVLTDLGLQLKEVRRKTLTLLGHGDEEDKIADVVAAAKSRLKLIMKLPDDPELDAEIEMLIMEKETAVVNQDFEKALILRKKIDEYFRKKKEELTVDNVDAAQTKIGEKEIKPLDQETIRKIKSCLNEASRKILEAFEMLRDR